jgi:hypothetical protein
MDARALREFLLDLKAHGYARGNFIGLLHLLIGRRIARQDGAVICHGLTWRDVAGWLKKIRWDKEAVRELNLDPTALPPRERERFWYTAILRAGVDSDKASAAADKLAEELSKHGYVIAPPPAKKP